MMVPAGAAVDSAIAHLKPHLRARRHPDRRRQLLFLDTERRSKRARGRAASTTSARACRAARRARCGGPRIMPGGQREAWEALAPIFRAIAAKADDGEPCVDYMGPGGAGHYVKMVHNGIEYGDMQLIAEAYDLLSPRPAGCRRRNCSDVFAEWNAGELQVVPDRDHRRGPGQDRSGDRPAAGRRDPRRGAAEGHRQVDQPERASTSARRFPPSTPPSRAASSRRSRPSASHASRDPARAVAARTTGDASALIEAARARALREQDHVVRAGVRPAAPGVGGVQVRPAARRHRADLARGLHHPRDAARRHHGGVPARRRRCRTCCSTTRSGEAVERRQGSWRFVVQIGRRDWASRCRR